MIVPEEKHGVVDGKLYNHDVMYRAYQLVEFEGAFYFVNDAHKVAVSTTLYLSETFVSGKFFSDGRAIKPGYYDFDAEGKMIVPVEKHGIYNNKLFIQTLGSEGIRFNLRGEGWVTLPPVANSNLVDWEGAGDWTTSAFLNALGDANALSIDRLTSEIVRNALGTAQEIASKSVSYLGSKGMIML
jgi:hypothetical protein